MNDSISSFGIFFRPLIPFSILSARGTDPVFMSEGARVFFECDKLGYKCDKLASEYDKLPPECDKFASEYDKLPSECDKLDSPLSSVRWLWVSAPGRGFFG